MTTTEIAPGLELVNPVAGTRTVFTATPATTDGADVEVEATYPPNSNKPPGHPHPSQTEYFTVLTGAMTVVRGDETFVAETAESFSVPPGVSHQMWNPGDVEAGMRGRVAPPLRTGELWCATWACARDHDWKPDPMA